MADQKVSALTELTSFSGDETFYVVEDDDGTPASRRVTVENLAAGLVGFLSPAWTSYTPTWTTTGSAPAIGNGTLAGAYRIDGKTLFIRIRFIPGSTTTFGTGSWSFSLPGGVTSVSGTQQYIAARGVDVSASANYSGSGRVVSSATALSGIHLGSGTSFIDGTIPFTWTTSDEFHMTGVVEIA